MGFKVIRRHLLLNILLAVVWCLFQENLRVHEFFIGFLLGYGVIFLLKTVLDDGPSAEPSEGEAKSAFSLFLHTVRYAFVFLYELIKANLEVVRIVLSPELKMTPGIIAYPLEVKTDAGITLLANSITLTPGTLSVDISKDRKTLYIHALHMENAQELKQSIHDSLEQYSKEILG